MSANIDNCFKYIIGLSQTECQCFEAGKPDDYNSSDSGVYLDEGLDLKLIQAARDCSANSIWNKMMSARHRAVKDLKHDLPACIMTKTKMKRRPFTGFVGDSKKFTVSKTVNTTYAGIKIRFADIVGGYAKIKRIGLVFEALGTFDVHVYNNLSPDLIITYSVTSQANRLTWVDISDIDIDMNSPFNEFVEYYFIYQYNAANKPKDTKFDCMCGGSFHPGWSESLPQYNTFGDKGNFGWAQYAMAQGIKGNSISDLTGYPNTSWGGDNYTYGLILDVQFGCKAEKTICNEALDYESNPYALAMAYAVKFKAQELLLNDIIMSSDPNYYTVLASEALPALAKECRREYEDRVKLFLCEEISKPENINDYSDCFTCKDEYGFMKVKLLN